MRNIFEDLLPDKVPPVKNLLPMLWIDVGILSQCLCGSECAIIGLPERIIPYLLRHTIRFVIGQSESLLEILVFVLDINLVHYALAASQLL